MARKPSKILTKREAKAVEKEKEALAIEKEIKKLQKQVEKLRSGKTKVDPQDVVEEETPLGEQELSATEGTPVS